MYLLNIYSIVFYLTSLSVWVDRCHSRRIILYQSYSATVTSTPKAAKSALNSGGKTGGTHCVTVMVFYSLLYFLRGEHPLLPILTNLLSHYWGSKMSLNAASNLCNSSGLNLRVPRGTPSLSILIPIRSALITIRIVMLGSKTLSIMP